MLEWNAQQNTSTTERVAPDRHRSRLGHQSFQPFGEQTRRPHRFSQIERVQGDTEEAYIAFPTTRTVGEESRIQKRGAMMSRATWPHAIVLRVVLVLGALAFSVIQIPTGGNAQSCTNCVVAAGVPLNLLQEPRLEATVLQTIPRGSLLVRGSRRTGSSRSRMVACRDG